MAHLPIQVGGNVDVVDDSTLSTERRCHPMNMTAIRLSSRGSAWMLECRSSALAVSGQDCGASGRVRTTRHQAGRVMWPSAAMNGASASRTASATVRSPDR